MELDRRFPDIPGLLSRVEPGGIVPAGECPGCGALCYPVVEPRWVVVGERAICCYRCHGKVALPVVRAEDGSEERCELKPIEGWSFTGAGWECPACWRGQALAETLMEEKSDGNL